MAQRIFNLAKELKIETKELLEVCQELKLQKTSALASLTDEEVSLVKEYLKRGKGGRDRMAPTAGPTAGPISAFRREDYIPPAGTALGKVPVLDKKVEKLPPSPPQRKEPEKPEQPEKPEKKEEPELAAPVAVKETPEQAATTSAVVEAGPPQMVSEGTAVVETTAFEAAPPPLTAEAAARPAEPAIPEAPLPEMPPEAAPVTPVETASSVGVAERSPVVEEEKPASPTTFAVPQAEEFIPTPPPLEIATAGTGVEAEPSAPLAQSAPETVSAAPTELAEKAAASQPPSEATPSTGGVPPIDPERLAAIRPIPELRRTRREGTPPPGIPKKEKKGKTEPPLPRLARLAPIPQPKPSPVAKPKEPPPQKPEIRLPLDAIKASKMGAMPLAEHLLRQQEEKRKGKKKEKEKAEAEEPLPVLPRQKGRRGKVEDKEDLLEKEAAAGKVKRKKEVVKIEEDEDLEPETTTTQQTRLRRTRSVSTAAPRKSSVVLELPCTVRSFAEALGLPAQKVLAKLFEMGTLANINATLDQETAELLAAELGVDVTFRAETDPEEEIEAIWNTPDPEESLRPRPPVVTFLGHVDHGKTSLLDKILGLNVAAKEKGGITQHIRAYQVEKNGRPITFLDTPGHEAFTAMRARGANCTDIVVLVVAVDDGVMPQTEEAISHARAAGVPIVVALNKVDLPGARPERVMQQLTGLGLVPTEWGGDVEMVRTSALTGQGIPELLDTLITLGDIFELKANYDRPACGTCLEASLQPGRGVVAKFLVQKGTLRPGDIVVCGTAHGRIKAMYDPLQPHKRVQEAPPARPVDVIGLDNVPEAGSRFVVLEDIAKARKIAEHRLEMARQRELAQARSHVTLENLFERLSQKEKKTLHIILRADTRGSIEAILKEIAKLEHPEVKIEVIQALVGGITVADVHLADASDAVIIGFNVVPDEDARELAEQLNVQIRRYDIIYQVADDLKAALEGMLQPEKREVELGRALIQKVFRISKVGNVAGCRVLSGIITRDARLRVIRQNRIVGDYPIESLRREKDDVREVREGYECGIRLAGFDDIKEGDILEAYRVEEVKRSFETVGQSAS
ncbi:translation initiation factor IF-2 [Thermogutta sp.]|uniref:translation initiation factor IF-2 n=1 Tax=Thermogutta sp. TaxID=1962930 RepID=UPI003C7D3162